MSKIRFLLFFLLTSTVLPAQTRQKKAIFVIVDGIPADVIEKLKPASLKAISQVGKYTRASVGGGKGTYSETPTISAVGYNSLLTGTWVNKHNVWDNDIKAPNYHYPTIFKLFKERYPAKKIAIFSSWTDNRTKLVGEGLSATGQIQLDYHSDGYELDTLRFPHDQQRDFMHRIDETVTDAAVSSIQTQAPDLSWVYLEYTDDMGHMYGDSPQFHTAIEQMDAQVGRLWQAIQARQAKYAEDWLLIITTDHGRDEQTGKHHGGQSARQRSTWMVTNYAQLNTYARYFQPAIVDLMPTIARFMNVSIPQAISREVDGLPLIGKVSIANPELNYIQGRIDITWKALEPAGKVKVWVATSNEFKTGGKDTYQLLAEVNLQDEHASIETKNIPSSFYKVVLETPSNTVNKWLLLDEKK